MNIKNLTPHTINFVSPEGHPVIDIEPAGTVARVSVNTEMVGEIDGIPVTKSVYGEVVDLPEPEDGTIYIVSALVAGRVPEREDVFIPSESVRDENGRIIGCKSLGHI